MSRVFGLILMLLVSGTWAQRNQLKAYIDSKNYYSPEHGNFLELHYQYVASSVKFESVDNDLVAKVIVKTTIVNSLNNDTISKDMYLLQSPRMRDSVVEDFYDVVRYPIKPGSYLIGIELQDANIQTKPVSGTLEVSVPEVHKNVGFSDIMIAEVATPTDQVTPMYKSGYEMIPRISNFYGEEMTFLPYYVELYNTNLIPDSVFGVRQQVVNAMTNSPMDGFSRFIRMNTGEVQPLFRNVDLSKLPSGSYRLRLEMVDRNNNMLSGPAEYYFERVNDSFEGEVDITKIVLDPAFQQSVTDDSLRYYLASLLPIARPAEAKSILETIKSKNLENYRKHLQQFWIQTSGSNAYSEWLKYKEHVMLVQTMYGTQILAGYETDRGRVYLQYGPPNSIIAKESSPSEYPYEIWHYYKIKHYSNKRFVFYNPDLITENYRLLHSDMLGEPQNYKWPQMLVKRNTPDTNTESQDGGTEHYGGESNYYYRQY